MPLEYSENGELMLDIIKKYHLNTLNTFFSHKLVRRTTRITPDKNKANQIIDYIHTGDYLKSCATNCRVYRSVLPEAENLSDHHALTATFRIPPNKFNRPKKLFNKDKPKCNPIKKLELNKLKDAETQANFCDNIKLPDPKNLTPTEITQNLISSLTDSVLETLPQKPKLKTKFWSDDQLLQDLLYKKRHARNPLLKKKAAKSIKKHLLYLQNKIFKSQAEEISLLRETRQVEKEFQQIKNAAENTIFKRVKLDNNCQSQKLVQFAKSHLTKGRDTPPMPDELINPPQYILDLKNFGNYEAINQDPPTILEIKQTLTKLRNNKASQDIPSELLKYALLNDSYLENLKVMFEKIWKGEKIPSEWGLGKIETIYKNKGSKKDAKNYRLLTIGSAVGKIFRVLIVNRLSSWYNAQLSLSQNGFRKNYGTTDAILRNKLIQSLAKKLNVKWYALFIDLSAAFDKVYREWVFRSIRVRIPDTGETKIIDLLESFYDDTSAYLSVDPNGEIFQTDIGVAQGGVEAPPLFCLFIDFVMRVYENEMKLAGIAPLQLNFKIPEAACVTDLSASLECDVHLVSENDAHVVRRSTDLSASLECDVYHVGNDALVANRSSRTKKAPDKSKTGINSEKWNGYADDTTLYQLNISNLQKSLEIIAKLQTFSKCG